MPRDGRRQALLAHAQTLRVPKADELNKPLGATKLENLRVVTDGKLAERLVSAGLATRFQRRTHLPRKDGRKLPTVLEIHADGAAARRGRAQREVPKPTVEELRALIARIAAVETELLGEKTRAIGERIAATKRRLIELSGEEEANAIRELSELSNARRSIAESIRRDAFARIEADREFAPRRWLSWLSPERSG
jgi:hypothetical protein